MDACEIRAKAIELTIQTFSVFDPAEAKKLITELKEGVSMQHKIFDISRVFELYIEGKA